MNYIGGRNPDDATVSNDLELEMINTRFDPLNKAHVALRDKRHPTQPGRTMMGDLE